MEVQVHAKRAGSDDNTASCTKRGTKGGNRLKLLNTADQNHKESQIYHRAPASKAPFIPFFYTQNTCGHRAEPLR